MGFYFSFFEYLTLLYMRVVGDNIVTSTLISANLATVCCFFLLLYGFFFFRKNPLVLSNVFLLFILVHVTIIPHIIYAYNNVVNWWNFDWFDFFIEQTMTITTLFTLYSYSLFFLGIVYGFIYVLLGVTKKSLVSFWLITACFWGFSGCINLLLPWCYFFVFFGLGILLLTFWLLYFIKTATFSIINNTQAL